MEYYNITVSMTNSTDGSQPLCRQVFSEGPLTPGAVQSFNCSSWMLGRYVVLKKFGGLPSQDYMIVCEVAVNGCPVTSSKHLSVYVLHEQRQAICHILRYKAHASDRATTIRFSYVTE